MSNVESTPAAADAQSPFVMPEPTPEHAWLQRLIGDWIYETDAPGADGQTTKMTGTERVRAIGRLWVVGEAEGTMPTGDPASSVITLGFDPQRQRFTGSWIGSMMTHFWVYDGELDAERGTLALYADGPSMSGDGTTSRYRDTIALIDADHRTLTGAVLGKDGTWQPMMSMSYRRAR